MDQRKALEELAKKRGVSLVAKPSARPAPQATPAPVASGGFMARPMPEAAAMMAELKAQLPPEIWAEAMDNLKKNRGFVVDLSTNIALGFPPLEHFEYGKSESREGFTIRRVRPKESARGPAPPDVFARSHGAWWLAL